MSVTVGKRVARLRTARGDSLREAAARTGVSHTTIARIEKGEVTGSLDSTLRAIAVGYGVPVEFLLGEQEPWAEFQRLLAGMGAEQRAQVASASRAERVRMIINYLAFSYPGVFTLTQLAEASRLDAGRLESLLSQGQADDETLTHLAGGLQRMCGIDPAWLVWGGLNDKEQKEHASAEAETLGRYITAVQRAAANAIDPDVLEMAVEMLALQGRHVARVAAGSQHATLRVNDRRARTLAPKRAQPPANAHPVG